MSPYLPSSIVFGVGIFYKDEPYGSLHNDMVHGICFIFKNIMTWHFSETKNDIKITR